MPHVPSFHPKIGNHYTFDDFKDIINKSPEILNYRISYDVDVGPYISMEDGESILKESSLSDNLTELGSPPKKLPLPLHHGHLPLTLGKSRKRRRKRIKRTKTRRNKKVRQRRKNSSRK